jgi:hypothetical protein
MGRSRRRWAAFDNNLFHHRAGVSASSAIAPAISVAAHGGQLGRFVALKQTQEPSRVNDQSAAEVNAQRSDSEPVERTALPIDAPTRRAARGIVISRTQEPVASLLLYRRQTCPGPVSGSCGFSPHTLE